MPADGQPTNALARWKDLCIDAVDPDAVGRFWAQVLGETYVPLGNQGGRIDGARPEMSTWVNRVPEPKQVKNRVHLDIAVGALQPLLEAGGRVLRPEGDGGIRWTVLADPEGGEFCAFLREHLPPRQPALRHELVVDTRDTTSSRTQARWWADLLGGRVVDDDRGFSWVQDVPRMPFDSMDFIPVPEPKTVKNRVHVDVAAADVAAVVEYGASVLREPDGEIDWHVLADPEGNEFCAFGAT